MSADEDILPEILKGCAMLAVAIAVVGWLLYRVIWR